MRTRLLSFIFLALVAFCLCSITVCAESEGQSAEFLYELGIINDMNKPDGSVTRKEAAKAVVGFLNLQPSDSVSYTSYLDVDINDSYCDAINLLHSMKIISGEEGRTFEPDRKITYNEYIKMLVSALGYELQANNKGGYPQGYNIVANELDLTKGVDIEYNDEAQLYAMYDIMVNALDAKVNKIVSITNDSVTYESNNDQNALKMFFNIDTDERIVEEDKYTSLYTTLSSISKVETNGLIINGEMYFCDEKYKGYVGKNVKYRYQDDKILYLEECKNKTWIIDNDDILSLKNGVIKYYDEEKEKKIQTDNYVYVIYNGKSYINYGTLDKINFGHGFFEITDNDNDGKAEVISVTSYENIVVRAISSGEMIINDKITGKSWDFGDKTDVMCYNQDNEKIELTDILVGDILSVAASINTTGAKLVQIYVSKNIITDKVTSISDDEYTILNKVYKIYPGFSVDVDLNKKMCFYIDKDGYIVYAENIQTSEWTYSVLRGCKLNKLINSKLILKVYNEKGKFVTLEAADKIFVNGNKLKVNDIDENALNLLFEEGDLILYKIDNDIIYLITDDSDELDKLYTENSLRYRGGMCSSKFIMDNTTKIFSVPTDVSNEDMYTLILNSSFETGTNYQYDYCVYTYGENRVNFASAVVFRGMESMSIENKTPATIITGIVCAVHDDETVDCIKGLQGNIAVQIYAETGFCDSNNLSKGDVIRYGVGADGLCNDLQKVYDINGDDENAELRPGVAGGVVDSSLVNPDADNRFVYGTILDTDGTYVKFKTTAISATGTETESIFITKGTSIAIYDKETKTGWSISINDLIPGYNFVAKMTNSHFSQMYIIK